MPFKPGGLSTSNVITPSRLRALLRNTKLNVNTKNKDGSDKPSTPEDNALFQTIDGILLNLNEVVDDVTGLKKPSGAGAIYDDGDSGTAASINWSISTKHLITLTGNVTLTLEGPVDGGEYILLFDSGAGGFNATWPGNVLWPGGTPPTITAAANSIDRVDLLYRATTDDYLADFKQDYQ